MERSKTIIYSAVLLIILSFFIWAILPKEDYNKKVNELLKNESIKADITFKDATYAEIYDGVKYWELVAKTSLINKTTGIANLFEVNGLFYDNGLPTIKFIAPRAVWHMNNNEINLTDPIGYDVRNEKIVKNQIEVARKSAKGASIFHLPDINKKNFDGYWFTAKNLNWKLATKKLLCDGNISLTKGNVTITSQHLAADVGLEKVLLTGSPSAEMITSGERTVTKAQEIFVDSSTDILTASTSVEITNSTAKINSDKYIFDQNTDIITFPSEIYVVDGLVNAYAGAASYNVKNKKISLIGKAKAKRGDNELFGEKMTLMLGENKIMVEGRTKAKVKESEIR
jgi:lipopolysaccharide transport protein LptA